MEAPSKRKRKGGYRRMAGIDWEKIGGEHEKHEALKLKVGNSIVATFQNDGNFVDKATMEKAEAKYPIDAYVFHIQDGSGKDYDFWVSTQSYSVLNQLKTIRGETTLKGKQVEIKRVSDSTTKTNYQIEAV